MDHTTELITHLLIK